MFQQRRVYCKKVQKWDNVNIFLNYTKGIGVKNERSLIFKPVQYVRSYDVDTAPKVTTHHTNDNSRSR